MIIELILIAAIADLLKQLGRIADAVARWTPWVFAWLEFALFLCAIGARLAHGQTQAAGFIFSVWLVWLATFIEHLYKPVRSYENAPI